MAELDEIRKILKDHDKRISKLESSKIKPTAANKTKKPATRRELLIELIAEGFFKQPKTIGEMADKCTEQSYFTKTSDLTKPLQYLVREHFLRRFKEKDEWVYVASGKR